MLKKVQPPPLDRILRFMALWFFCFSLPAYANSGLNWLVNQAQPDGHYSTPNDLATPFQATAETWRTLTQLGETPTTQLSNHCLTYVKTKNKIKKFLIV